MVSLICIIRWNFYRRSMRIVKISNFLEREEKFARFV